MPTHPRASTSEQAVVGVGGTESPMKERRRPSFLKEDTRGVGAPANGIGLFRLDVTVTICGACDLRVGDGGKTNKVCEGVETAEDWDSCDNWESLLEHDDEREVPARLWRGRGGGAARRIAGSCTRTTCEEIALSLRRRESGGGRRRAGSAFGNEVSSAGAITSGGAGTSGEEGTGGRKFSGGGRVFVLVLKGKRAGRPNVVLPAGADGGGR